MNPRLLFFTLATILLVVSSCALSSGSKEAPGDWSPVAWRRVMRFHSFDTPPPDPTNRVADDPRAIALGEELFGDVRLSGDQTLSCATCHHPARDFADGLVVTEGVETGTRNSPSLWNVAWGKSFFWDGRASTLWGQAIDPIEDPKELGGDRLEVLHRLAADARVRGEFEALFGPWPDLSAYPPRRARADDPSQLTDAYAALSDEKQQTVDGLIVQVGKVIAAFQRSLVSGETPFDRHVEAILAGEPWVLSPEAEWGMRLFVSRARCHLCHHGPVFSDGGFHATGVAPLEGGAEDLGRWGARDAVANEVFGAAGMWSDDRDGVAARRARTAQITPADYGAFRTPPLRNIARTAPYMHGGQFQTLREVVQFYSDRTGALPPDPAHPEPLNEPLNLSEAQIDAIVAFLESLSDVP